MSTLSNLTGGDTSGQKEDVPLQDAVDNDNTQAAAAGGSEIPTWAWGAAAGGLAALAAVGTSIWHFASRRRRREQARDDALQLMYNQSNLTPRENATPRPPPPPSTPAVNLI